MWLIDWLKSIRGRWEQVPFKVTANTICALYLQNSCPKCFRSPLLEGRSVHGRGLRVNTPFPEPSAPPCPGSLHTLLPLVCNLGGPPVPWTHTEFTVILAPAEQSFW